MKLDRFRAPALAATAVLLISGVATALAASPAPAQTFTTAPITLTDGAEQVETVDTDTLEEGDQTSPDGAEAAGAEAAGAEAAGAEADGPGGWADPEGQNVDHQFDGEE